MREVHRVNSSQTQHCPSCGAAFECGTQQSTPCWCSRLPPLLPLTPNDNTTPGQCLCPQCLAKKLAQAIDRLLTSQSHEQALSLAARYPASQKLMEHLDYTVENGLYVFTAWYHLKRGYCCGNGCRHCPYPESPAKP